MRFTEYDADDADQVEAGRLIINAASDVDSPWMPEITTYRREMRVRHGWDASPVRHILAWEDGLAVAVTELELGEWDNKDLAWIYLIVHPDHRRRGHGSTFLEEVERIAREAGCTKIGGSGWESPGSEPFAKRHGFERASQEIYRLVSLPELAAGFAEAAHVEAAVHAGGAYELIRIEGHTPADLLPPLSELTASINDAPLDDLDIEDEVFPVARIRNYENATIDSGHRLYRTLARHLATGELAGHTVVAVDTESPRLAHQHDTTVVRAHRGHSLGQLLKADMMRWLAEAEPQIASIDTWNAESNEHMIRVNERLGYRALGRELVFQRRL